MDIDSLVFMEKIGQSKYEREAGSESGILPLSLHNSIAKLGCSQQKSHNVRLPTPSSRYLLSSREPTNQKHPQRATLSVTCFNPEVLTRRATKLKYIVQRSLIETRHCLDKLLFSFSNT